MYKVHIYEKATKFSEISPLLLTVCTVSSSFVKVTLQKDEFVSSCQLHNLMCLKFIIIFKTIELMTPIKEKQHDIIYFSTMDFVVY